MKIVFKLLLLVGLLSCKSNSDNDKKGYSIPDSPNTRAQDTSSLSYKRGNVLYSDFCVTCHLSNGKGVPGNFPPLDGSDWLTKKRSESIHAIKFGLSGPIIVNGEKYNSVMVSMGLSNEEIADIMNYINNSWGNSIKPSVTVEEVSTIKK